MKTGKQRLITALSIGLLAAVLSLRLAPSAQADEAEVLTPETAVVDTTGASAPQLQQTPQSQLTPPPPEQTETLYGSVKETRHEHDGTALQGEAATAAPADVYALAVQKLQSGAELSSDEYRSLGFGTTGIETLRTFFQKVGKVIAVYPGSPGDLAGIRVGDKVIENNADNEAKADPTIPLTEVTISRAGTIGKVTILRSGKPVTYNLVRMNIEDISVPKYRKEWEQMVRNVGQKEGTFIGRSTRDLEHSPNIRQADDPESQAE